MEGRARALRHLLISRDASPCPTNLACPCLRESRLPRPCKSRRRHYLNPHYRNQRLCRVSQTHGKGYFTLGKGFAECNTRQRTLGELYIGNSLFAEYFLSGTRQRLCRVSFGTRQRKVTVTAPSDGDGSFAECILWHSAKRPIFNIYFHSDRFG
jgi:hypothetical protein